MSFRKLPGLGNSPLLAKQKPWAKSGNQQFLAAFFHPYPTWIATPVEITLKSLTHNVFTVRIFHPKRAWSGFGYPGADKCWPGDSFEPPGLWHKGGLLKGEGEVRFRSSRHPRITLFITGKPQKLDRQKYTSLESSFHKLLKNIQLSDTWVVLVKLYPN